MRCKIKNTLKTYIRTTRFGPTPILTAVTTKCIGVASSHSSFLGKVELFFINVKSPLTAASTCTFDIIHNLVLLKMSLSKKNDIYLLYSYQV